MKKRNVRERFSETSVNLYLTLLTFFIEHSAMMMCGGSGGTVLGILNLFPVIRQLHAPAVLPFIFFGPAPERSI
jgi:hypothetical protein